MVNITDEEFVKRFTILKEHGQPTLWNYINGRPTNKNIRCKYKNKYNKQCSIPRKNKSDGYCSMHYRMVNENERTLS